MRLTFITPVPPPAAHAAGTSPTDKAVATAARGAAQVDDGVGVVRALTGSERTAPFDADRVAEIRKALQEDRYPLVPAEIADALIAAKLYGILDA